MRTAFGVVFLTAMIAGSPVGAGPLLDKAKEEGLAYAETAGYVASTVTFCGGPESEIAYFKGLVAEMLMKVGADAEDVAFIHEEMDRVQKTSTPRGKHCTDDGGLELSAKLENQRQAIAKALK